MIDKTTALAVTSGVVLGGASYFIGNLDEPVHAKVKSIFADSIVNRAPLGGLVDEGVVTIQYCDS